MTNNRPIQISFPLIYTDLKHLLKQPGFYFKDIDIELSKEQAQNLIKEITKLLNKLQPEITKEDKMSDNLTILVEKGTKVKVIENIDNRELTRIVNLDSKSCFIKKNGKSIYRLLGAIGRSEYTATNAKGNIIDIAQYAEVYEVPFKDYVKSFIDELTNNL